MRDTRKECNNSSFLTDLFREFDGAHSSSIHWLFPASALDSASWYVGSVNSGSVKMFDSQLMEQLHFLLVS